MRLFLVTFVLTLYSTGATVIEGFVNYPTWRLIEEKSFLLYHRDLGFRIIVFLVIPYLSGTILTGLLLLLGPALLPRSILTICLLLQLTGWISTLVIQLPIQRSFDSSGFSASQIHQLIVTDRWFRQLPNGLNAVLFAWLMLRVLEQVPGGK